MAGFAFHHADMEKLVRSPIVNDVAVGTFAREMGGVKGVIR